MRLDVTTEAELKSQRAHLAAAESLCGGIRRDSRPPPPRCVRDAESAGHGYDKDAAVDYDISELAQRAS